MTDTNTNSTPLADNSVPQPIEGTTRKDADQRLRAFIRQHLNGGCRILSRGESCTCLLCDLDRVEEAPVPSPVEGAARVPESPKESDTLELESTYRRLAEIADFLSSHARDEGGYSSDTREGIESDARFLRSLIPEDVRAKYTGEKPDIGVPR